MARPEVRNDHLRDRRPRGRGARGRDARGRRQARRRRDPLLLLRAASSASRSAPAACAWSRSRASPSSRPPARRRSRTAWWSTPPPTASRHAQNAVVEFLLINHPLDCPVCDKGGECPLQDISFGWGAGRSRFIEPKRHFKKPLELSPLIAIDRERCILCYRCVRFSQEIAEDYQLVFLERGDHTFVGTHDGRPYVAPFSGNIIELCPVGALTSTAYRFRARPWDIEDSGSAVHAVPVAVQRQASPCATTQGRARHSRATTTRSTTAGCATRAASATSPSTSRERITAAAGARRRRAARGLVGARAGRGRAGAREGRRERRGAGGRRHHQRGGLPRPAPDAQGRCGSPHVDSRARRRARRRAGARARPPRPGGARSPTSTTPARCSCSTPSSSTRPRSSTCACARRAPPRHAAWSSPSSRPSTLDPNAAAALRFAPGRPRPRCGALASALGSPRAACGRAGRAGTTRRLRAGIRSRRRRRADDGRLAATPLGGTGRSTGAAADVLRDAPEVVVIWGERVATARAAQAVDALLALAGALGVAGTEGRGPDRGPRGRQRPRPARGRLPAATWARASRTPPRRARRGRDRPRAGEGELSSLCCWAPTRCATSPSATLWEAALDAPRRDRVRRLPHRGARGARDRGLPGRVLRGEGGHAHAPRRPPAARAPGDRPPGRGARRLAGARRAVRADRRRRSARWRRAGA